jgi:hypothetical protein
LVHTSFGLISIDKVARTSAARIYAKFNIYLMPFITALAIFLILSSLMVMFSNAAAREGVRNTSLQYMLLIPGLNSYIPWTYGWIALVITLIIHEAGHGIVARIYGIKVKSTGLVLILGGIPIGAFVNIKQEQLAKSSLNQKIAILTVGPLNNMILAAISLIALYLIVSTLSPLPTSSGERQFDVLVVSVNHGSLAESLDISKGSIIKSIARQQVHAKENVSNLLRSNLGNNIEIMWQDETGKKITRSVILPTLEGKGGILGASIKNKLNVVDNSSFILEK